MSNLPLKSLTFVDYTTRAADVIMINETDHLKELLHQCSLQPVTGGLMNLLWKAQHGMDEDDMIAVKIFGALGEQLAADKGHEKQLMEALHDQGISIPLYAM